MDSKEAAQGVASPRRVRVAADGSTKEVGDLELRPGVRLTGRVVLSDGQPVPQNTRLFVGREAAWDSRNVLLNPDGTFDLAGIPPESLSLSLNVRGYHMSYKNKSLDRLNGGSITGCVETDTYLEILFEPGQFQAPDFNNLPGGVEWIPKDKPLQGAEGMLSGDTL
jgi:hypothetical protein